MRVTPHMISQQYSRNLNRALGTLNYYNNRATNFRKFSRASEDPISASKAYQIRREYAQNEDYKSNIEHAESLLLTAQSCMMSVNQILQEAGSTDILQGINGTMSKEDREIIAKKLDKMQESLVMTLNSKFADQYMFGGADTSKPPFSLDKDGNLLYKNINVSTGEHIGSEGTAASITISGAELNFGSENGSIFNDYMIKVVDSTSGATSVNTDSKTIEISLDISSGTVTNQDLLDSIKGALTTAGIGDVSKITVNNPTNTIHAPGSHVVYGGEDAIAAGTLVDLDSLAKETSFIDLGLGLKKNADGSINDQSVFDISLQGIAFLGYGTKDGIPNNVHTLLGDIADILRSDDFNMEQIQPYLDSFNNQQQGLLQKITEFGTKSNFLEYTKTRMSDTELNLTKKIQDVEYIDPTIAIMDFKMQEFSYRAALQMGTKILQPTFLDFMR